MNSSKDVTHPIPKTQIFGVVFDDNEIHEITVNGISINSDNEATLIAQKSSDVKILKLCNLTGSIYPNTEEVKDMFKKYKRYKEREEKGYILKDKDFAAMHRLQHSVKPINLQHLLEEGKKALEKASENDIIGITQYGLIDKKTANSSYAPASNISIRQPPK